MKLNQHFFRNFPGHIQNFKTIELARILTDRGIRHRNRKLLMCLINQLYQNFDFRIKYFTKFEGIKIQDFLHFSVEKSQLCAMQNHPLIFSKSRNRQGVRHFSTQRIYETQWMPDRKTIYFSTRTCVQAKPPICQISAARSEL